MPNNLPRYLNINTDPSLVRDTRSMGILNVNQSAYEAHIQKRKHAMERLAEDRRKDMELNSLRTEIAEIKQLLMKVLEEKNADSAC